MEGYYNDFATLRTRSNIREDDDKLIVRFLSGLSYEIRCAIELNTLWILRNLFKQQLKRYNTYKKYSSNKESSHWNKHKKGDSQLTSAKEGKSSKPDDSLPSYSFHSSIKCFEWLVKGHVASNCLNEKFMIAKDKEVYEIDYSLYFYSSQSSPSELGGDYELTPIEGDFIMVRRLLGVQVIDDDSQKENNFHTRCLLCEKMSSLIVDSGSCINVLALY